MLLFGRHDQTAESCLWCLLKSFYFFGTNGGYLQGNPPTKNEYGQIKSINAMSSADLVNWSDHGTINFAGGNGAAKWAANSWAPTAGHKTIKGKEKFFL